MFATAGRCLASGSCAGRDLLGCLPACPPCGQLAVIDEADAMGSFDGKVALVTGAARGLGG